MKGIFVDTGSACSIRLEHVDVSLAQAAVEVTLKLSQDCVITIITYML